MNAKQWLSLSASLNLILGLAMLLLFTEVRRRPAASRPASAQQHPPVSRRQPSALKDISRSTTFKWVTLESTNYQQYVANLRGIGCPEMTIREIIFAEINKLYMPKVAALGRQFRLSKANYAGDLEERERQKNLSAIKREKKEILEALLGPGVTDEEEGISGFHPDDLVAFSYLSPEKRRRVLELENDFFLEEQNVNRSTQNFFLPEDTAETKKIRERKFAEMAKILTPDELEQYELRKSDLANELRWRFAALSLTDDEFAKLYRARKNIQIPTVRVGDADTQAFADRQQNLLEQQLKTDLGDQRYQQLERFQDKAYQDMVNLSRRFELPSETADELYAIKQNTQRRYAEILKGVESSAVEKNKQIDDARRQTEEAVSRLLGTKVSEIYKTSTYGEWLLPH